MKPFTIVLIVLLCTLFFTTTVYAEECKEHQLSIESQSIDFTYVNVEREIELIGCFPDDDSKHYVVKIGSVECRFNWMDKTHYKCSLLPGSLQQSALNVDIVMDYTDPQGTYSGSVTKQSSFSFYSITYQYITPYSAPLIPSKTQLRIAISDLPENNAIEVYFNDQLVDLLTRQDNYLIIRLPSTFSSSPLDTGAYTIKIKDLKLNQFITQYPNAVTLYHPTYNNNRYITHTSPQWIPLGGSYQRRIVTFNGNGLSKAKYLMIYHPYTREAATALTPDDLKNTNEQAFFNIKSLSFTNTTIWPYFEPQHYADVDMYRGPIHYDILADDEKLLVSGEITFVPAPEPRFITPTNEIPINFVYNKDDDIKDITKVTLSALFYDFPLDVPTRIAYGDKWVLTRTQQHKLKMGQFVGSSKGIEFPLPPCIDCELPYTANLCLQSESSSTCLVDLGPFTYLPEDKDNKAVFTKTYPQILYYDNFQPNAYVEIFFYGVPSNTDGFQNKIKLRQREIGREIELNWELNGKHSVKALLPRTCAIPGTCSTGYYNPTIIDTEYKVLNASQVDFIFNPGEAYKVGFIIDKEYKLQDNNNIMDNISTTLQNFQSFENVLMLSTSKRNETEFNPKPVNKTVSAYISSFFTLHNNNIENIDTDEKIDENDENDDVETLYTPELYEDKKIKSPTYAYFIIRPNSTADVLPSYNQTQILQQDLLKNKDESILLKGITNLRPYNHTYESVTYCPSTLQYQSWPCSTEPSVKKSFPQWALILIIILVTIALIGIIVGILYTQTSLLKRGDNDKNNSLLDEGEYQQIN